jgi:putative ABC transport system permease protein
MASAREALLTHRVRSTLTLVGVSVGVLSVLAIAAYGQYASAQVARTLALFGSNLVAVTPANPMTRGARVGRVTTLTVDDATAIAQQVPHLLASSAVKSGSVNAIAGRYSWSTQVLGVGAEFPSIHGLELQSGNFLTAADERSTAAVAVLGPRAAAHLFPGVDPLGQHVRLNGTDLRIIGLLSPRGQSINGDLDDVIYLPLSTSLRRLYGGTNIDRIEARVDNGPHIAESISAITSLLERRHHIAPAKADDFQVQNFQQVADRAMQTAQALSGGLTAAAVLAQAIAGFGVMNIMLLSVSERTPEIGVRIAVGARSSDVRAQFLTEAVTLCLGGAVIGSLIGLIASQIVSQRLGVVVVPPATAILIAAAISATIGLLFGLYPAERAAHLDPIVALRTE